MKIIEHATPAQNVLFIIITIMFENTTIRVYGTNTRRIRTKRMVIKIRTKYNVILNCIQKKKKFYLIYNVFSVFSVTVTIHNSLIFVVDHGVLARSLLLFYITYIYVCVCVLFPRFYRVLWARYYFVF